MTATAKPGERKSRGRVEGSNPGLVVARVRADAPGDDNERSNGEYVVLGNRGSAELDLSGWRVTDEAGHTYVVPGGITLAPGARLTLYNSREADGNAELYWGATGAIRNNDGDTVTVRADGSRAVVQKSYCGD